MIMSAISPNDIVTRRLTLPDMDVATAIKTVRNVQVRTAGRQAGVRVPRANGSAMGERSGHRAWYDAVMDRSDRITIVIRSQPVWVFGSAGWRHETSN